MNERPAIQLSQPNLGEEEWLALREPLTSGWVMQGPKVEEFERRFARRHEVKHAVATTSCTTALHLILDAIGVGPGDEVIVPAFTWVATANAVLYCGARPVFVDIEAGTYNMDVSRVVARLTPRTKAIMAVHLFGLCADIDAIAKLAPGVPVVEDAACAAGSHYRGRSAGSLGVAAAFSFHPRKSITTGEGGMVTTDDDALAKRVRVLRNHGATAPSSAAPAPHQLPEVSHLGYNYRMTDLQAAVGLVQLGKLDALIAERQRWAEYYHAELSDVPWLRLPRIPCHGRHGWQSFVCYVDENLSPKTRNEIMSDLKASGISTRPGTHAVHALDYYRTRFGLGVTDFPVAWDCELHTMAIPLHNRMTGPDFERVVEAIRRFR